MADESSQPQMPQPDPALKRLENFVGTWDLKGRTLGAEEDNLSGRTTFEWLPGGFFLKQSFEANFMGMDIQSLEIIGYDPASDTFPSTVYSSLFGAPIPYNYDVRDNEVIITTDLAGGAKMTGKISEDGDTFSGGWRPEPGNEGPGNVAYDFVGTRVMTRIPDKGFVWHELMTTDTEGAQKYYREVTGITAAPGPYQMLLADEQPVGGLVGPTPEGPVWRSGGPEPHWLAYIGVRDVDAAARMSNELGGQVLLPPTDVPGIGRAAVLRDPQGAAFGIFTTAG